jgi:hypothetical protein
MTKALGATATSIPIRGAAGRRWAVICCILIVISLQFGMNRQFIFDLVSSSASAIQDNMVIWGSTTGRSITTRSPSILKQIDDLFGKRIIDDVDNLSEIRPDGVAIYPGAREWYTYWTHASQKGKPIDIFLVDDESAHIYDDYVASTVESVSEATLRHIQDMKSRYASVAALPDFYARGLGWVMDVSLLFSM